MGAMRPSACTRRAFVTSIATLHLHAQTAKGRLIPSERVRYPDPLTEFQVVRLTDPSSSCSLPGYRSRAIDRSGESLLYWSDRTGSPQAYEMDLRSGESRQLTEGRDILGSSLTLMPNDRSFCYFDGDVLRQSNLSNYKERDVYRAAEGCRFGPALAIEADGTHALAVEVRGQVSRLVLVPFGKGKPATLVEGTAALSDPAPRPGRAEVLYREDGGALWLVSSDGKRRRRLELAPGGVGPAIWSRDGSSLIYLSFPEDRRRLNALREHSPESGADRLVASTTQFVHFARNADASVFVGASGSKASPHILIVLRVTRRELTLCEHRASNPAGVTPVFSPDSQRIYFNSDRHGRLAIYSLSVEKLVERTES